MLIVGVTPIMAESAVVLRPADFLDLVRRRTSCRAYDPDRPVPSAALRRCLEAARLAPSACNRQPWRFVVVTDAETRQALYAKARLPGISHEWWRDVPVFVAVCAELEVVTHRIAPVVSGISYHLIDIGIAGEHLVLAAAEEGLGSCWIGWFREGAVKRLLGIPRRVRVVALITLGYPAAAGPDQPPPTAPRSRRDLDTIIHWDRW